MISRLSIVLLSATFTGCLEQSADAVQETTPAAKVGTTSRKSSEDGTKKVTPPTSRPSDDTKSAGSVDRLDETVFEHFGDGVAAKGDDITIASLVAKTDDLAGKKIRLTGKVEAVCKHKGCWMIVADGEKKVRVKFRDYGFFVPKDCEGRDVVLEGTFSVSKTSVAELKHLLEDEGKTEEAAKVTEPELEMKVMADGVALKRVSKKD
jgi:cytochrome c-type biogenesis protein CcmE